MTDENKQIEANGWVIVVIIGLLVGIIIGAIFQIQHSDKVIKLKEAEIVRLMDINEEQTYLLDSIYAK